MFPLGCASDWFSVHILIPLTTLAQKYFCCCPLKFHNFKVRGGRYNHHVLFFSSFYLFIYFWLHWVSAAVLSLVAVNRGDSSLQCAGCSLQWPLLMQCMGSRVSVVVAHGLSCPMVMWDLPGLGVEPMSPALPGGSLTMDHQGSPRLVLLSLRPVNISVSLGCKAFPAFLPLPWLQLWAQYLILCFVPRIDFSLLPFPFFSSQDTSLSPKVHSLP